MYKIVHVSSSDDDINNKAITIKQHAEVITRV